MKSVQFKLLTLCIFFAACGESSQTNNDTNVLKEEIEQNDSISAELEKAKSEIDKKTEELDKLINEL